MDDDPKYFNERRYEHFIDWVAPQQRIVDVPSRLALARQAHQAGWDAGQAAFAPRMYTYRAGVIDIYDGDTMTVLMDMGLKEYKVRTLRLYGINTPELRGEEREQGLVVRDYVREQLGSNTPWTMKRPKLVLPSVVIETHKDKSGKYGRLLATVYYYRDMGGWLNLNAELLRLNYAKEYGS